MIKALLAGFKTGWRAAREEKAISGGVDFTGPNWGRIVYLDGSTADPQAEDLTLAIAYMTSAYAFTAMDYRASRVAEAPLEVVVENDDGEDEAITDHPLADLLTDPSPDFDMGELLYLTESYRLMAGSALWLKQATPSGAIARLMPFSGDDFTTEAADGLIFGRYMIQTRSGRRDYMPDDVVHFREPNPTSWRHGTSRLEVALSRLNLGHQIDRTVLNFAKRAMFLGGVISPHPEWDPDQDEFDAYKNSIEAWLAGPANAGKPMVALGGTTVSDTAARMKDILPVDILDRIEATVGSVFGVPPVVLGWLVGLKNSPWSQMGEARRMVTEDTIQPRWVDVERRLTRGLLTESDRALRVKIRFDLSEIRALFDDDKLKADVAAVMRREWTLNERRVYTGQEPLDDERGDEIEGGSADGGLFGDLGTEGEMSAGRVSTEIKTHDDKGLQWLIFDGSCKAAERSWEREVSRGLAEWKAGLSRLAQKHLRDEKGVAQTSGDAFRDATEDWMKETGKPLMQSLVYPLVLSTSEGAVRQVAAKTGVAFDVFEPSILRYAERESAFLADVMGETTGKKVADVVQKGLEEGDIVADLVKRLEADPGFSRTRAKLVARTETTRAWNGSQRESMSDYQNESGRIVTKIWLKSQDDRVRPEHAEIGGEQADIDAEFSNGLTEPSEPNCRCTLLYQITDPLEETQ